MLYSSLIASWLAIAEPDAATEADGADVVEVEEPVQSRGTPMTGRVIATLVDLEGLEVRAEYDVLPGEQPDTIDAVFDVATSISHRLDGSIREIEIGIAVLDRAGLEFAWTRLHTPPLRLASEDAERKMPLPVAVLTLQGEDSSLSSDDEQRVVLREAYPDLPLPKDRGLTYLLAVGGYTLEAPSERDVLRILDEGGPADLAALANWAADIAANEQLVFDDGARARIMANVDAQIRRLRAPPAFGDFQRLNALTTVARICASGEDLERLLLLVRPMTILLSAAQVSYDGAAAEEVALGVSVHGFRRLQSRSDSALAWESTLRHLRSSALDRLVRLAYEPEDFPDAPATRPSPLHVQASRLLLPLTTTEVARVLALAAGREATQRELLRFYVEARYPAVAEPLVEWLVEHPSHVDDIGVPALDAIGDRVLPILVRRFDDREASPTERTVVWRLLASLPERHAAELGRLSLAMGVDVDAHRKGPTATLVEILDALRDHDERTQRDRIAALVEEVAEPAKGTTQLRARVRAAELLAATSPELAVASADAIIAAHVEAARAFDIDFPLERRATIRRLGELPLGARHADATRAAALVDAELAAARGESEQALTDLERFDPTFEHEAVRAAYVAIVLRRWDELVIARAWDDLDELLARVENGDAAVAEAFDVPTHRNELDAHRRRPKIALGIVIGAAVFVAIAIALHVLGVFTALRRRRSRPDAGSGQHAAAEDLDDGADDAEVAHEGSVATPPGTGDAGDDGGDDGDPRSAHTDTGSPLDDVAA